MMSGIFVGDITQVLYFEFKKNLHSLSKLVKYRGVRRFFAFVRNVYLFSLTVDGRSTSWYGKYPIIYRVFFYIQTVVGSEPWDFWTINRYHHPLRRSTSHRALRRQGIKQAFEEVVFKILDTPSLLQSTPRQWEGFECGGKLVWVGVVQSWMLLLDFCSKALSFEAFSIFFVPHGSYSENLTAQEEWCHVTLFFAGKGTLLLGDITGSTVDFLATSLGI